MRIDLEKLDETGGKFSRTYKIDDLTFDEHDLTLVEPVTVEGRIRREGLEVELRGHLRAKAAIGCGRCLKSVELPIELDFTERFTPAVSWKDEEQHELSEADLDLSAFDGEGIELDDLVKEEIMLAMPGHTLCSEECKGLCPNCGIDFNAGTCDCATKQVDSRWEKLKDLKL
jgi:uncharacterized protein